MDKTAAAFTAGVIAAMEKHAVFGRAPVEGATKTIAGVTKILRGGKWILPSKPSTLQSVAHRAKGLFAPKKADSKLLAMARRTRAGMSYAVA